MIVVVMRRRIVCCLVCKNLQIKKTVIYPGQRKGEVARGKENFQINRFKGKESFKGKTETKHINMSIGRGKIAGKSALFISKYPS
jgi:hypothetical protein